jgi:tRNA-uridine 2-sulfurtransferase
LSVTGDKVLVGMSGGIDSTVTACLLRDAGYEVTGITFRFVNNEITDKSIVDAQSVCHKLGIEHLIYDATTIFEEKVIHYFVDEYFSGRTPFPCAVCNPQVKWKLLIEEAGRLGCSFIAMGHYIKTEKENGQHFLRQGVDPDKDQSFFCWGIPQQWLSKVLFPLGVMMKKDVKQLAVKFGFNIFKEKKESTGPCFCQGDYRDFLRSRLTFSNQGISSGIFTDSSGNLLGKHDGYPFYTVGQRRGLGIHLNKAVFVKEIIAEENKVVLGSHAELLQNSFIVERFNIHDHTIFSDKPDVITRIRYRKQNTLSRIIRLNEDQLKVELSEALDAIAPGQTAVFYREGRLLGGGFIAGK